MSGGWEEKARAFAALHRPGDPLILYNAWDAGSAKVVAEAGARAIASGSWSVAAAFGYADGEALPLDLLLATARRMVEAVELPVTIDFEGAYAADPAGVGANSAALRHTGAVGCNFEDRIVAGPGLYAIEQQRQRIAALRETVGPAFFINARTDVFLASPPGEHGARIDEALRRAKVYAEAGASGLFFPGLVDEQLIARVCAESPLPVNIMIWPGTPPLKRLARLGAARISHAGAPWRGAMRALAQAAGAAHRMEG